jgi:hypothetical protein
MNVEDFLAISIPADLRPTIWSQLNGLSAQSLTAINSVFQDVIGSLLQDRFNIDIRGGHINLEVNKSSLMKALGGPDTAAWQKFEATFSGGIWGSRTDVNVLLCTPMRLPLTTSFSTWIYIIQRKTSGALLSMGY